jgi:hypothetical protein
VFTVRRPSVASQDARFKPPGASVDEDGAGGKRPKQFEAIGGELATKKQSPSSPAAKIASPVAYETASLVVASDEVEVGTLGHGSDAMSVFADH